MTPDEQLRLLVRLCAMERDGKPLPDLGKDSVRALADAAGREGVSGWLTHRLTESYGDWKSGAELRLEMRQAALSTVCHNAHVIGVAKDVTEKLRGIETVLLKGAALIDSPFYSDISHRLAGDIDIWVDPAKIFQARDILIEHGAEACKYDGPQVDKTDAHLPQMRYEGLTIELHGRLFNADLGWDLPKQPGAYAMEWHGRRMLRPDAMTHHLVMHAYKHYVKEKVRLRWIVDLAVMISAGKDAGALTALCEASTPDSGKALRWAMGVTLPLLPVAKAKEVKEMGYAPLDFATNKSKGMSIVKAKRSAIVRIIRKAGNAVARAEGLRCKASAAMAAVRYELRRTRLRYPGDSLATGIIKRIFIRK